MSYLLLLKIINYQNNSHEYTVIERKKIREQYKLDLVKNESKVFFTDKLLDDL